MTSADGTEPAHWPAKPEHCGGRLVGQCLARSAVRISRQCSSRALVSFERPNAKEFKTCIPSAHKPHRHSGCPRCYKTCRAFGCYSLTGLLFTTRSRYLTAPLTLLQHFLPIDRHLISENGDVLRVHTRGRMSLVSFRHPGHPIRCSEREDTPINSPATLLALRTESAGLILNPSASRLLVTNGQSPSLFLCHGHDLNLPPAPSPVTPPRIMLTLPHEVRLNHAGSRTLEEILVTTLFALRPLLHLRENCLWERKIVRVKRSPPIKYIGISQITSQDVRGSRTRNAGHLD